MEASALRIAKGASVGEPAWLEQIGAFGDGKRHPSETEISVAFAGLVPMGTPSPVGGVYAWFTLADVPQLAPRQRLILDTAVVDDPRPDGPVPGGIPAAAPNVYPDRAPADVRAAPRKATAQGELPACPSGGMAGGADGRVAERRAGKTSPALPLCPEETPTGPAGYQTRPSVVLGKRIVPGNRKVWQLLPFRCISCNVYIRFN